MVRKGGGRADVDGIYAGPKNSRRPEITLNEKIRAIQM